MITPKYTSRDLIPKKDAPWSGLALVVFNGVSDGAGEFGLIPTLRMIGGSTGTGTETKLKIKQR